MSDLTERLAEALAVCDAATEGPWEDDGGGEIGQHWSLPEPWQTVVSAEVACMAYCYGGSAEGVRNEDDATFIAHARTGYPAALRALQVVMDYADYLKGQGFGVIAANLEQRIQEVVSDDDS